MKYLAHLGLLVLILQACDIKQEDIEPTDELVKIYNHPNEDLLYYAESVLQTTDGFLLLAGVKEESQENKFPKATLIGTNKLGEIQWTTETRWLAPVKGIVQLGNTTGFVAMNNERARQVYFIQIDPATGELTDSVALGLTDPLAAAVVHENRLVVLSYDNGQWNSVVTTFNADFQQISSIRYSLSESIALTLENHLRKTGVEYPFFIGEWETADERGYMVNGLSYATLGVRFYDYDGNPTGGWLFAHQVANAPSSLLHKADNEFAFSWYYNHRNYLMPSIELDVSSLQNFNDSTDKVLYELPADAKIRSDNITFDGAEYMVFASGTNSNAIQLSLYTIDEEDPIHIEQVDFSDRVEVVDLLQDPDDEGIVVLARLYFTGKYVRPLLIKVPKEHFITEE